MVGVDESTAIVANAFDSDRPEATSDTIGNMDKLYGVGVGVILLTLPTSYIILYRKYVYKYSVRLQYLDSVYNSIWHLVPLCYC